MSSHSASYYSHRLNRKRSTPTEEGDDECEEKKQRNEYENWQFNPYECVTTASRFENNGYNNINHLTTRHDDRHENSNENRLDQFGRTKTRKVNFDTSMPPPQPVLPRQKASVRTITWPPPPQAAQNHTPLFIDPSNSVTRDHHPSQSQTATHTMATSAISFHETNHGRQRRIERAIPTREIQTAIKHGVKLTHPKNPNLLIFKHDGKEHIVTKDSASLVTTMVKTVSLKRKDLTEQDIQQHDAAMRIIHAHDEDDDKKEETIRAPTNNIICIDDFSDLSDSDADSDPESNNNVCKKMNNNKQTNQKWRSHSVIIVDKSGSMQKSDVNGCRTRLGAVWLSLAQDYVEHRIKTGMATSFDVISIILMGDTAQLLIDRWPTNYTLYNRIVQLFHESEEADRLWQRLQDHNNPSYSFSRQRRHQDSKKKVQRKLNQLEVRPLGHGCYGPSLTLAEQLLVKNDNESSALSLLLLSDGRPSDYYVYKQTPEDSEKILKDATGRMASRFGRRFTFGTIGMGSYKEFDTLQALVGAAKDFGGIGTFSVPSMSCAAIGRAISSVATSLAMTQTELMSPTGKRPGGGRSGYEKQQRRVRQCIRESKRLIPLLTEIVNSDEFDIHMNNSVEHYE